MLFRGLLMALGQPHPGSEGAATPAGDGKSAAAARSWLSTTDLHVLCESVLKMKPAPEVAPSTLAVVGRYVLTNRIFSCLEKIGKGAGGEIQLTDGIEALMQYETVLAYRYHGRRFDCGSKLGYLQA